MSTPQPDNIGSLGEEILIERIRRWLGPACPPAPRGPGDDCAVTPRPPGRELITIDPVVRGQHFAPDTAPADVAAKLLNRNLSDIAAMGGRPRRAVISLAAPPDLPVAWIERFYRALGRIANRRGVEVVGGDCAQTDGFLVLTLALVGDAPPHPPLRSGARPGDLVFVTGALGGSILGRHLRFTPRLDEGRWLAARRDVHAAIDVSDGLGKDLRAIVPAGMRAVIDPGAIPVSAAARRLARQTGRPPLDHAINDGEDFELLFAAAPREVEELIVAWHRRFSTPLSCIARIRPGARGQPPLAFSPALPDGVQPRGYEHFR